MAGGNTDLWSWTLMALKHSGWIMEKKSKEYSLQRVREIYI
jgi:hypothetical protein